MEPLVGSESSNTFSLSRHNSFLNVYPEKEPLVFHINLNGAPPEIEDLVQRIRIVAEQFLYHWKTFPIVLPKPISKIQYATESSISQQEELNQFQDCRKSRSLNLPDLFIAPPFDELDAVALDGRGEPKLLSSSQLKSLRDEGEFFITSETEFSVPSVNFPGQMHRWRVSHLLQKGHLRARETLLRDLASAAEYLFVTAKSRIFGRFFSILDSGRAIVNGVLLLIDMMVGIPSLTAYDLDHKIKEERTRFLVAELICRPEYEDCLDALCCYVRNQLQRATTEKFDVENETMEMPIPYLFQTPNGLEIDLRLFSKNTMRKALPIIVNILERERRGWFLHFRERLISELRERKKLDIEIEEEVNEAVMQEYLQRVYESILNNADLASLGNKIPQLLVQQAQQVVVIQKAVERVQKEMKRIEIENQNYLLKEYPILSKIKPWLQMKLLELSDLSKSSKYLWSIYDEALKMTQNHNLQQATYFLFRDLAFVREREPVLLKELQKAKTPTRFFQWPLQIWSAKKWIVIRNFQGTSEIIQTIICQQATSIVTPRSDPSQPVFLVEKEKIRANSTRWPFWRLVNLIQRFWCYTWNIMYLFGIIFPIDSPLGLRALFCIKPFMPELELSQINGTLFPRKSSITHTLVSILIELWRHVSKARTRFEIEPDTGFIGKGITRKVNQFWNYFIIGFMGTSLIIFIFPLLCIVVSVSSVFIAITAPLWIPVYCILLHLYIILIYDLDSPSERRNRCSIFLEAIVLKIIVQGCLQALFAVLIGGIMCPFAALAVFCYSLLRYSLRIIWDSITFNLFIKRHGRVPSNDCFSVKRIAGPGLFGVDFYYSIKPEQALAAFEAKIELEELEAFQQFTENYILQPQRDFKQFVEACFGSFSSQFNSKSKTYIHLERESRDFLASLNERLDSRRRELEIGFSANIKNRIRMHSLDLKIAVQHGACLLERFFPHHIFNRLPMSEEEFWDSKVSNIVEITKNTIFLSDETTDLVV